MGLIGALIDVEAVVTDVDSDTPKMCHVAGNVYAIVNEGVDQDGFVATYTIDAAGNIAGPIDSYEFDTDYCVYPEIAHVIGIHYAIIYQGGAPNNLRLITVKIADNGIITHAVTSSVVLWAGVAYEAPRIMLVDGTTDKFLYTYDTDRTSGVVGTRTISALGVIGAEIDFLTFDAARALRVHTIHVTGNIYVVVYQGVDDDGFAKTFTVDAAGNIGDPVEATLEFEIDLCAYPEIAHISGIYYVIAYTGPGLQGKMVTITIDAAGAMWSVLGGSYVFDATKGSDPSLTKVGTSLQFAVAYSGTDDDGYIKTVPISALGIIGVVEATLEYETNNVSRSFIMLTSGNIYVVTYRYNQAVEKIYMRTLTIGEAPPTTVGGLHPVIMELVLS